MILAYPTLRFWSASLLFVFDGAPLLSGGNPDELLKTAKVKMIDFANATEFEECDQPDTEYLCGLDNLLVFLQAIRNGEKLDWIEKRLITPPTPDEQDKLEFAKVLVSCSLCCSSCLAKWLDVICICCFAPGCYLLCCQPDPDFRPHWSCSENGSLRIPLPPQFRGQAAIPFPLSRGK